MGGADCALLLLQRLNRQNVLTHKLQAPRYRGALICACGLACMSALDGINAIM